MNRSFIVTIIILSLLGTLLYLLPAENGRLFYWINTALPNKTLWMSITNCGEAIFAACLIFIILHNNNRLLTNSLLAGLVAHYVIKYLKLFFAEPRPEHTPNIPDLFTLGPVFDIHNYGMPSGHTANAFMVAIIIIRGCSLTSIKMWAVLFAATLVGISRITVGAHWPCDVFVGAALGLLIGLLFSHDDLNLQHKIFKYLTLAFYLPFFALAIMRVTQIDSTLTLLSYSAVVLAGVLGLMFWIRKVYMEIKSTP
jgi:membrane-associated phospholipid phosphatase